MADALFLSSKFPVSYRHPQTPTENPSQKPWIRSVCIVTLLIAAHSLQRFTEKNQISGLSARQVSFSQALTPVPKETDLRRADPQLANASIPFGAGNVWLAEVAERAASSVILPAGETGCEQAKGDRPHCQNQQ